jgi:hypothetical protein
VVLSGGGAEFERDLPFSVFVDALDAYVTAQDLSEHEAWNADLKRELGEVLPSLRGSNGGGAIADERYRAHRAVRRLLGLLADERPLVLDDLHWSDGASIELIAALVRRQPAAPVLLALGFRPGQAAERLAAALAGPPVSRLELGQLSETEAAELLEGADAEVVSAIYGHAGGNPFYLEQLGRAGDGAGLPRAAHPGAVAPQTGVPPAVAAAIAEELESLSAQSRAFSTRPPSRVSRSSPISRPLSPRCRSPRDLPRSTRSAPRVIAPPAPGYGRLAKIPTRLDSWKLRLVLIPRATTTSPGRPPESSALSSAPPSFWWGCLASSPSRSSTPARGETAAPSTARSSSSERR